MQSKKYLRQFCILSVFGLYIWTSIATEQVSTTEFANYKITEIASGLDSPWAIEELEDDVYLLTEKPGQLRLIKQGVLSKPISNMPSVFDRGQGGLLDVVLHPKFTSNGWIYLSYAVGDQQQNALRLMRAKLRDGALVEQHILFTVTPWKSTPVHYGGRLAFLPDETLLLTIGDGFDYRESAQKMDSLLGKIVRLNDDGSIPKDNPFVAQANAAAQIWSIGHRNPQGIVFDAKRKIVFANEHGPKGGDEINIIKKAKNYGWPVITNGVDYSGASISPFKDYPGMQQPWVDWTPSIAPSALAVYYGTMFPELTGDLLTTTLKSKELRRIKLQGLKVLEQHSLMKELNSRLRDIMINRRGAILLLTDDGKVIEVSRD